MSKKIAVPDAWDDDWDADNSDDGGVQLIQQAPEESKLTKAQILARHEEENRKVWQSAEQPELQQPFHLLAEGNVPLKSEFKPTLKLLSRKPAGIAQDGEDENNLARNKLTAEELRAKTQREREEKAKKYEEVRARLFGTDDKNGSSSPGNVTPTGDSSRNNSNRGRGRGRGGNSRGQQQHQLPPQLYQYQAEEHIRRPVSGQGQRELFDPNYTAKPYNVSMAQRNDGASSGRSTPKAIHDGEIIRGPRGPGAGGRGEFGFASRGNHNG